MITYLILATFTFFAYKLYYILKCPKELENIPAVSLYTFIAFYIDKRCLKEKMDIYYQPYLNEYGVIRVFNYTGWAIMVGEPKIAKEVFSRPDVFEKPNYKKLNLSSNFKRFFGLRTVLVENNQEWKRHRKVINPIFNQTWPTELFGSCVQDLIDQWEKVDGGKVKIQDKIQRMTLDVFGKALFNIDFKAVKNDSSKLYNLYHDIFEQIKSKPLYIFLPFLETAPYFRRPELSKKLDEYHEFIEEIIKVKKEELKNGTLRSKGDLISALIESNENSQEYKLTIDEIRDNLNLFIVAGHDTTSNTLMGTLYYLARYPEIQNKLRNQVLAAMDNPKKVQIPTIDQLKNMPLMDLVNKESMRIMTTLSAVRRVTSSIYTMSNGLVIPNNTTVIVHLWGIHHNPAAFADPYEFRPERFNDISNKESKNWQAFALGSRICLGSTFSLVEQRVTIAMLLQKFEFSISNNNPDYQQLRVTSSLIVRPKDLLINIKPRF